MGNLCETELLGLDILQSGNNCTEVGGKKKEDAVFKE